MQTLRLHKVQVYFVKITYVFGRTLMKIYDIDQLIQNELSNVARSIKAAQISKIANKHYKLLPVDDEGFLELCEIFLMKDDLRYFSIATLWFKKRKSIIEITNFHVIERWLLAYINGWGTCDQFCYRILNPFIEKFPELYSYIEKWSQDEKTYIRRASVVCMLYSSQSFKVNYPIEKIMPIVKRLINDKELHVQKGVGWLLKYAYISYPEEIASYLKDNVHMIPRVVFRYSLEKMPTDLKNSLIKIPYK